jgi:hypothetical protein
MTAMVSSFAVLAPELAAVAHERGHRGIDDDVGGHVQVRDALVAVDVAEARAGLEVLRDAGGDRVAAGELAEAGEDRAEAVVAVETRRRELRSVRVEDVGEERADDVAEDDRVADLHHRGLEVHRVQHVSAFACAIVSARNASSAFAERNVASTTSRGRTLSPP